MLKTRNRLIAVGIALLLIIAAAVFILPAKSANADTSWDGSIATAFAGGDGSANNPYQISNGAELAYLAQEVNAGNFKAIPHN